jgi:hypothetical protein
VKKHTYEYVSSFQVNPLNNRTPNPERKYRLQRDDGKMVEVNGHRLKVLQNEDRVSYDSYRTARGTVKQERATK